MSPTPSPGTTPDDDPLAGLHPLFRNPTWAALARADRSARAQRRAAAEARDVASPRETAPAIAAAAARQALAPTPRGDHRLVGKSGTFSHGDERFTGYVAAVSSDELTLRVWNVEDERLRILDAEVWAFRPDGGAVG